MASADVCTLGSPARPILTMPTLISSARRRGAIAVAVAGILSAAALAAPAGALGAPLVVGGATIYSTHDAALAGAAVANVGDVNGDGATDIVIGAPHVSTTFPLPKRTGNGEAYVVFGPFGQHEVISLDNLGSRGFKIIGGSDYDGTATDTHLGAAVAGVGDVNGDGLADVGVMAEDGGVLNANNNKGFAAIIFGGPSTSTVDLHNPMGARGFQVDLPSTLYGHKYLAISAAGDLNGDGLADFAISDPFFYDPNSSFCNVTDVECARGDVYVILGRHAATRINVNSLGPAGFKIIGPGTRHYFGMGLAAAGDLNGDGRGDLVIGDPQCLAPPNSPCGPGSAFVLYGRAFSSTIDLALPLPVDQGFRVDGPAGGGGLGTSVSVTGDVNGDGRPDLLLGAPYTPSLGRSGSGAAYLFFTPASPPAITDLGAIGTSAALIVGGAAGDGLGAAVSSAGDVDGDGLVDIAVSAPHAGAQMRGSVYVVRSLHAPAVVDTSSLSSDQGYELRAPLPTMSLGTSLVNMGDLNADGRDEILLGGPGASVVFSGHPGRADLQFDAPLPSLTTFPVQNLGDTGASLSANIFPSGQATGVRIQFGTAGVLGAPGASVDVGSGTAAVPVLLPLTGLTPLTTYSYRLVAANASGTVYGRTLTFTTLAAGTGPGPGPGPQVGDTAAPVVRILTPACHASKARCRGFAARRASWKRLRGTVTDALPSAGVKTVQVAAVLRLRRGCVTLGTHGFRAGRCSTKARWTSAQLKAGAWSLKFKGLPRGSVRVQVRATDNAGHTSSVRKRTLHLKR